MGAWLAMAVGDERLHGGNDGYDDEPSQHYSWDSTVPNHDGPKVGDVIALWDRKFLLGVSVIEDLVRTEGVDKVRKRCPFPDCRNAGFYRRKEQQDWVCRKCRRTFTEPEARTEQVTTYRTEHGVAWVDMAGLLSGPTLRGLCDSPRSQHSLRSFQWEKLRAQILATGAVTSVNITDTALGTIAGGHRRATVRVRIGQAAFRAKLLATQGETCAFTGPAPAAALEAAHLYSYAAHDEHHDDGGLLLRRDVHRLFDLGHIAVHPERLTLDLSDQVRGYATYAPLHGAAPVVPPSRGQRDWLAAHWEMHRGTTST